LSAATLTLVIPGVARTDDLSGLFPIDVGTRIGWYGTYGRTRITGEIVTVVDTPPGPLASHR
jgi:hypothetical protein